MTYLKGHRFYHKVFCLRERDETFSNWKRYKDKDFDFAIGILFEIVKNGYV